jgi:hypothetical protein
MMAGRVCDGPVEWSSGFAPSRCRVGAMSGYAMKDSENGAIVRESARRVRNVLGENGPTLDAMSRKWTRGGRSTTIDVMEEL